jgi:hypothetical protein
MKSKEIPRHKIAIGGQIPSHRRPPLDFSSLVNTGALFNDGHGRIEHGLGFISLVTRMVVTLGGVCASWADARHTVIPLECAADLLAWKMDLPRWSHMWVYRTSISTSAHGWPPPEARPIDQ